jgi:hypothetical protein
MISIPSLVGLFFALSFFSYESLRFYATHHRCSTTYAQNELLLRNPLCADPYNRFLHGPKQEEACTRAHNENLVSPTSCALRALWHESEPMRVWRTVIESHWMLFGLGSVAISVSIIMWSRSCTHKAQLRARRDMHAETMQVMRELGAVGGGNHHERTIEPASAYDYVELVTPKYHRLRGGARNECNV